MEDLTFDQVMKVTKGISSPTAFSDIECRALFDLCMEQKRPDLPVVEIGCQLGRSSSIIAQVGKHIGYRSIHVDPYIDDPEYLPRWHTMMRSIGNPYTFLCMKSYEAAVELTILCNIGARLVLIDGDHSKAGVLRDCIIAASVLAYGGTLAFHDYGRESLPDVKSGVDQYMKISNRLDFQLTAVKDTLAIFQLRP